MPLNNDEGQRILDEYEEKSRSIIRRMIQVVAKAHQKVDEHERKKWIATLNTIKHNG